MDSEDTRSPFRPEKEAWTTVMGRYSLFDPAIVLFKMSSRGSFFRGCPGFTSPRPDVPRGKARAPGVNRRVVSANPGPALPFVLRVALTAVKVVDV
jgi:hypothetical protein